MKNELWILAQNLNVAKFYEWAPKNNLIIKIFPNLKNIIEAFESGEAPRFFLCESYFEETSVLKKLKKYISETSVFVFCKDNTYEEIEKCFAMGARDCFCSPISLNEIFVKLERIINSKKVKSTPKSLFSIPKGFTLKEAQIYELLHSKRKMGLNREEIVNTLWPEMAVHSKTIDVHICNLRKKLKDHGKEIVYEKKKWMLIISN